MRTPTAAKKTSPYWILIAMIAMITIPAIPILRTVRRSAFTDVSHLHASPYGYTVSLLFFLVPIVTIGFWFIPQERIKVSRHSFWTTIALLFPLGAALDFFFAHSFFSFPDPAATLGISAPAIGGGVPIEEYVFYLCGFLTILLTYIWLDEYWLNLYSVPGESEMRANFDRLLKFHPESLVVCVVLIMAAILCRKVFAPGLPGFPGYFTFLVVGALGPSMLLLPAAKPVINWRAVSLTMFTMLLTSVLWEATLAVPYGWWGYQPGQMIGIHILAWDNLPIEAVVVWLAVTYSTVVVYETMKRWRSSGKAARHAFLGTGGVPAKVDKTD